MSNGSVERAIFFIKKMYSFYKKGHHTDLSRSLSMCRGVKADHLITFLHQGFGYNRKLGAPTTPAVDQQHLLLALAVMVHYNVAADSRNPQGFLLAFAIHFFLPLGKLVSERSQEKPGSKSAGSEGGDGGKEFSCI